MRQPHRNKALVKRRKQNQRRREMRESMMQRLLPVMQTPSFWLSAGTMTLFALHRLVRLTRAVLSQPKPLDAALTASIIPQPNA